MNDVIQHVEADVKDVAEAVAHEAEHVAGEVKDAVEGVVHQAEADAGPAVAEAKADAEHVAGEAKTDVEQLIPAEEHAIEQIAGDVVKEVPVVVANPSAANEAVAVVAAEAAQAETPVVHTIVADAEHVAAEAVPEVESIAEHFANLAQLQHKAALADRRVNIEASLEHLKSLEHELL